MSGCGKPAGNDSPTLPDTTSPEDVSAEYAISAAPSSDYQVPAYYGYSTYYGYWGYYPYWYCPYWGGYSWVYGYGYWGPCWNDYDYRSYATYPQTASSYVGSTEAYSYLAAPKELDLETTGRSTNAGRASGIFRARLRRWLNTISRSWTDSPWPGRRWVRSTPIRT